MPGEEGGEGGGIMSCLYNGDIVLGCPERTGGGGLCPVCIMVTSFQGARGGGGKGRWD